MKKPLNITSFLICFFLIISFANCKKDTPTTTTVQVATKLDLMTKNVFIYDSVINNWGLTNQSVSYARIGTNNLTNWSNERLKFYRDGTFDEIMTNGNWRQGNWSMSSDSTTLITSGSGYSNSVTIVTLTTDKLVWLDNINKVRGVQIPKY